MKDIVATASASLLTAKVLVPWRLELAHRGIAEIGDCPVTMQRELIAGLIAGEPTVGAEARVDAAALELLEVIG